MKMARWLWIIGALATIGCGSSGGDGSGGGGDARGGSTGTSDGGGGGGTTLGKTFAKIEVSNASGKGATRDDVPVTFGEPFAIGDVPKGAFVVAEVDGKSIPLQVDAKATHADGSLRHAVLTAIVPRLPASGHVVIALAASDQAATTGAAPTATDVLATSFDASLHATIGGTAWSASAREILAKKAPTWLEGPLVTEWSLSAPLANGKSDHPHLAARFDVRAYKGSKTIWVSATIENDWAYEPSPQNFTYDAKLATDAKTVFEKSGLVHYAQSRWRKAFFWGDDPAVDVAHDVAYLRKTASLPNIDPEVVASKDAIAMLASRFSGDAALPMGVGIAEPYMPTTGGRGDIGPLPSWSALALISQDPRALTVAFGSSDLAGSWNIHYRDKKTGLPVSLDDHPYLTLLGNPGDDCDPMTKQCDGFPACGGDCSTPFSADSAHQPSFSYLPYLLTGERYHLEELEFWADYDLFQSTPVYRGAEKGLLDWDQVRGQAWSLRTIGQTAFILPDDDPLKKYFVKRVENNLAYYTDRYPNDPKANALHFLELSYVIGDDGTMAPWMDDFFTWSVGYLFDLGFSDAKALRDYKAAFPVGRMNAPGVCFISASVYHLAVAKPGTTATYATFADAYHATLTANGQAAAESLDCGSAAMASALGLMNAGEMVGYAESAEGYPSNLQPALAIAAESGIPGADKAWATFASRKIKPDYSTEPQFAIVPR